MNRVIQLFSLIGGGETAFDGQYLVEFDPSRNGREPGPGGRAMSCHLVTTPHLWQATRYTPEQAVNTVMAVDERYPERPDGEPNRPLTAFTLMISDPSHLLSHDESYPHAVVFN